MKDLCFYCKKPAVYLHGKIVYGQWFCEGCMIKVVIYSISVSDG